MSMQYNATVKVLIPQLVHCVHCDAKYIYEMERTGHGCATCGFDERSQAHAKRQAEEAALNSLDAKLNNPEACDPIPCNKCYRHQPYMRAESARRKYDGWGCAAWFIIAGGICALALGAVVWNTSPKDREVAQWATIIGAAVAVGGIGFFFLQRHLRRTHNPDHASQLSRRKTASERTMTLVEYNEVQMMRIRRTYSEYVASNQARPWADKPSQDNPFTNEQSEPEGLIVGLWVEQTMFLDGGLIPIKLSDTEGVAVVIPPDAKPGGVYGVVVERGNPMKFQVRITPIRLHPDEMRLD